MYFATPNYWPEGTHFNLRYISCLGQYLQFSMIRLRHRLLLTYNFNQQEKYSESNFAGKSFLGKLLGL